MPCSACLNEVHLDVRRWDPGVVTAAAASLFVAKLENTGRLPWIDSMCISQYIIYMNLIERNLEVKWPTIWIDGKREMGRVREETGRINKIREERRSRRAKK